jgi:predicted LPLAT superfamily acyltransferase
MIKQRGSGAGLFIVYLFFRFFGYSGLRFILYFVVFYFSLTTPLLKRHLREYYLLCTGKFSAKIYYHHLYTFALVFSDRFLSKKFTERYHIRAKNEKPYLTDVAQGALFLFSHVGDWSTCGLLYSEQNTTINIVMQEAIKESIQGFGKFIEGESASKMQIIDLSEGPVAVAVRVAKAFQNGEIVAMMADRFLAKESSVPVTFLGQKILMNKNPFEVAYNRKVPLIALLSLRESDYHYNAYYYRLTPYNRSIPKEEAIAKAVQEYADILEKAVKEHPDQWFNHYDFFGASHTE